MATIRGQVTDANGVAQPGVQVTLTPDGGGQAIVVATDNQGNYDSGNIAAATYTVTLGGANAPQPGRVQAAAGNQAVVHNVQLQPAAAAPGSINGQVTDAAGNGVPNVQVTATSAAGAALPAVQSDNAGNYNIPNVAPGQYNVSVAAPAGMQNPAPVPVQVAAGAASQANFQLQPQPAAAAGSINGRVTDAAGNGVQNVQVTATLVGGAALPAVQSDNAGNYNIPNVAPGQYNVTVVAPAGMQIPAPVQAQVAAGAASQANVQLQAAAPVVPPAAGQPGTITGRVTDQAQAPLPRAVVTATLQGGAPLPPAMSDLQGNYTIANVPPGVYSIDAAVPGAFNAPPTIQAAQVAAGQVLANQNFLVQNDPVATFLGTLVGTAFEIESPVSMDEARYAIAFFEVASIVFAGLTENNGQPTDLFGSQRISNVAKELAIQETDPNWRALLQQVEQLKNDVRDRIGAQSLQRLKQEAKRQFNLGRDNTVAANVRFPSLFKRFVDISTDPLLTLDIDREENNNLAADRAKVGQADALLRELKDIVVQIVKSLSREGQAQTRVDAEQWVPVANRALRVAAALGPLRNTGDADDRNPWAVLSVITRKNRDTEVTPYVVLGRHGGQLLQLAMNIYQSLQQVNALTTFDAPTLRGVFQNPRMRAGAGVPRMFFTDQLREQATYVKNYPVANWG